MLRALLRQSGIRNGQGGKQATRAKEKMHRSLLQTSRCSMDRAPELSRFRIESRILIREGAPTGHLK
jgi:hypothetical protein